MPFLYGAVSAKDRAAAKEKEAKSKEAINPEAKAAADFAKPDKIEAKNLPSNFSKTASDQKKGGSVEAKKTGASFLKCESTPAAETVENKKETLTDAANKKSDSKTGVQSKLSNFEKKDSVATSATTPLKSVKKDSEPGIKPVALQKPNQGNSTSSVAGSSQPDKTSPAAKSSLSKTDKKETTTTGPVTSKDSDKKNTSVVAETSETKSKKDKSSENKSDNSKAADKKDSAAAANKKDPQSITDKKDITGKIVTGSRPEATAAPSNKLKSVNLYKTENKQDNLVPSTKDDKYKEEASVSSTAAREKQSAATSPAEKKGNTSESLTSTEVVSQSVVDKAIVANKENLAEKWDTKALSSETPDAIPDAKEQSITGAELVKQEDLLTPVNKEQDQIHSQDIIKSEENKLDQENSNPIETTPASTTDGDSENNSAISVATVENTCSVPLPDEITEEKAAVCKEDNKEITSENQKASASDFESSQPDLVIAEKAATEVSVPQQNETTSTSATNSTVTTKLTDNPNKMSDHIISDDSTIHPTMPLSSTPIQANDNLTNETKHETVSRSAYKPELNGAVSISDVVNSTYQPLSDEFFKTIFYFSGMGTVIGSALSEGVHVEERHRGRAVEPERLPAKIKEQKHTDEFPLVVSCREQAHNIYNGLRNLHNLLDSVPTYSDSQTPITYRPSGATPTPEVTVDNPIHGDRYFRVNRRKHDY